MLRLEGISKNFGGFTAVNDCSLDVAAGTITGLIGPNGAGKTTLFNLIAGAEQPNAGRIYFEGHDITGFRSNDLFHRGLVRTFQIPREFHRLSALENLMMVPPAQAGESLWANWIKWGRVKAEENDVRARAFDTLEFLGLEEVAGSPAGELSGGQKKLLELGRTMMTDARLVLLDEPAAGVNRTMLRRLEEKIQHLNEERGYTFLLIEHDMEMVEKLCDPVICLAEGRILITGDYQTVRHNELILDAYLGDNFE